ncbi:unnamed protein product [Tenebrio molitor]|nr:unnamed protein product [Tenebrio molitor]
MPEKRACPLVCKIEVRCHSRSRRKGPHECDFLRNICSCDGARYWIINGISGIPGLD